LDRNGKWLGSVSHDDTLKLTDVSDLFEESDDEGEDTECEGGAESKEKITCAPGTDDDDEDAEMTAASDDEDAGRKDDNDDEDMDSSDEEQRRETEKAKRNAKKDQKGLRAKLAAPEENSQSNNFFDDL
jgi:hypothetical protein